MFSIFVYLLILCALGTFISNRKAKEEHTDDSTIEIIGALFVARVFPILMIEERANRHYVWLSVDLFLMSAIVLLLRRIITDSVVERLFLMLLIYNPAPVMCILAEGMASKVLWASSYVILLAIAYSCSDILSKKEIRKVGVCTALLQVALSGIAYAVFYKKMSFRAIVQSSGNAPTLLIISLFVMLAMLATIVWLMITGEKIEKKSGEEKNLTESVENAEPLEHPETVETSENPEIEETSEHLDPPEKKEVPPVKRVNHRLFDRVDILLMIAITAVFGLLAIFRLGSTKMPQTYYTINKENKDIVLHFAERTNVAHVYVFLDRKAHASISFSYRDGEESEWTVSNSKEDIKRVFQWTDVKVNKDATSLGLVYMGKAEHYITEIVITDKDGNRITPVNANKYPELFDEQELFPEARLSTVQTMFDEVYHVRTAWEFIQNTSIYETTHPPLGKTLIALGIRAFGRNPFGFRFICWLFGTLTVPFFYLFGKRLTKRRISGIVAEVLIATEFMHFAVSRIGTLDVIIGFWIIAAFYFMYAYLQANKQMETYAKQYLLILAGGFMAGFGIATKWTGFYAGAGLCLLLLLSFYERKSMRENKQAIIRLAAVCVISYVVIPFTIYLLSYQEFVQAYGGTLWSQMTSNAKIMLSYHEGVKTPHIYQSEWYEWLWDKQPLLYSCVKVSDTKTSSIATFGSPLIVWGGLIAFVYMVYLWRVKRDENARFIALMYLANLMPWLLVHRTVFIYHYYPCIMTLILAITYGIVTVSGQKKRYIVVLLVAALLLFVMFFSEISGLPIARDYINDILELFKTWRFA